MSETTETEYPAFSEASENDVREAAPETDDIETAVETPQEAVETPVEAPVVAALEAAEEPEDDAQTRAARLARDLREQRRRARQLELENQTLRGQRTAAPDEALEREIANRAAAMAQQQAVNQQANNIYNSGVKEFGRVEFDESVKAMNETFGAQMPVVIDTLTDIQDAQRLIQFLGDNPDLMDDYAALPPHKLGAALAKQAAKLAQPKVKPMSKAPPPIKPIATQGAVEPEMDMEKMSMAQLDAMWTKRDFEQRNR